jgi:aspartate aminotransferase
LFLTGDQSQLMNTLISLIAEMNRLGQLNQQFEAQETAAVEFSHVI